MRKAKFNIQDVFQEILLGQFPQRRVSLPNYLGVWGSVNPPQVKVYWKLHDCSLYMPYRTAQIKLL